MSREKVGEYVMRRSWNNGMDVEQKFVELMEGRGATVKKATVKQDRFQHIDYFVNGYGVDVKAGRKCDSIWLETVNVGGHRGWLNGDADFIAFYFDDLQCFKIFRREELLRFIEENVTEKTTKSSDYMKFYTRAKWDRKDVIVKSTYDHIRHIKHTTIFC